MKQIEFPILTYIEVIARELYITTIALIDTGSEVPFFHQFLLPRSEKLHPNQKVQVKGIHLTIAHLEYLQNNILVILGNKILNIPLVFQYNSRYDILLGSDFLK